MKHRPVADLFLYRWRYAIGYGLLIILFVCAVLIASLYVPGGLSQAEIDTLGITNQLSPTDPSSFAIPNNIFHTIQAASIALFGLSILTIKLPSIILSVITAVAIFFLLRRWFRSNVAVLSLLIMATTGQFIFLAQNATPSILYVAWTALILLFASLIVQRAKHALVWKICLSISVVLSLYTPYFWYINLGLLIGALIHPHTRYRLLSRKYRARWLIASVIGIVLALPLVYLGLRSTDFLWQLLGLGNLDGAVFDNLRLLIKSYVWPIPFVIDGQILPLLDFSALMLVILGVARTIQQRETARAYMIGSWLLIALPLLLVQPAVSAVATVPLFILLAVGVETLIREWYRIFPKNPYARTAGLVLIVGLIGVMILGGMDRYIQGYHFMPEAVSQYNTDLPLVKRTIAESEPAYIVSGDAERSLYDTYARKHPSVTSTNEVPEVTTGKLYVTHQAHLNTPILANWHLERIVTNGLSSDGDRLYVYKIHEK